MTTNDYLDWLKKWFSEKLQLPADAETRDIFAEKWLTSLDALMLVVDIEKKLKIKLSDESLGDKRFLTMNGIAEILRESDINT
ncbi:MAG: phosphopantetheine-binding protein [Legionella sp.]|nr:phosphopantetheine-binding protein [Legionella sp.]